MSIQFNNGKIEDQYNGLVDMQQELLAFSDTDRVTAIVTYEVTKDVRDRKKGETYPVVRPTHIEPIRSAEALEQAKELQASAYQVRTGETALDLPGLDEDSDAAHIGSALGQALSQDVGDAWDAEETGA